MCFLVALQELAAVRLKNIIADYIGDIPEEDDGEDEDYYSDYDRETSRLVYEIKNVLERLAI